MSTLIESKRLHYTTYALSLVREAQRVLRACGAINAATAVSKARKSVEGAVRHAQRLDSMGDEDLLAMRRVRRAHARRP